VAFLLAVLLTWPLSRRWLSDWGSSEEERSREWPGDRLVSRPELVYTRGIDIAVAPRSVWPWVVQFGLGRAGFYSYELFERIFGIPVRNVESVIPEMQSLEVGDEIKLHPKAPGIPVAEVSPGERVCFGVSRELEGRFERPDPGRSWSIYLRPTGSGSTRLLLRGCVEPPRRPSLPARLSLMFEGPIDFLMEQRMLRTIRRLAETGARSEAGTLVRLLLMLGTGFLLGAEPGAAQQVVEQYDEPVGYLRIGPEPQRQIAMTERGHTLLLPDGAASDVRGVTVFIDPRRFPSWPLVEPGSFDAEALDRGVAVLHITTGDPLDFLFEERAVQELVDRIGTVLDEAGLAEAPVFLAGLSLGGTRALRLAAFLGAEPARAPFRVAAVAMVDAPLDMARLWATERRAADLGFHPAAADEGRWVTYLLEKHLGGDPAVVPARYVAYSPFSHGAAGGGNAVHVSDLPIRAYHEPDVDWWIENRRKSYYDINSIDLAALVNQLRILGNDRVELVSTHRRRAGYAEGATPHTWSIVDDGELVEWFLSHASPG
jgi:hypothetical protein